MWNLFFCIVTLTYNKSQFKPWKVTKKIGVETQMVIQIMLRGLQ